MPRKTYERGVPETKFKIGPFSDCKKRIMTFGRIQRYEIWKWVALNFDLRRGHGQPARAETIFRSQVSNFCGF